jgi:hypothetical protein
LNKKSLKRFKMIKLLMKLQLNKFKNQTLINLKVRSLKIKKEKSVKEEVEAIEEIVVEVEIDLIESKDPINLKELRVKLKEKADQDKEEGEEIDQELQLLVILERTTKDFKKSGRTMNKKEQEEEVEEEGGEEAVKEEIEVVIEVEEKVEEAEVEVIREENKQLLLKILLQVNDNHNL